MSSFSQFVGVGPKRILTAYVDGTNAAKSTGTGEDTVYWDFTLGTSVDDYTKCEVHFSGGISRNDDLASTSMIRGSNQTTQDVYEASARLTSNSNLRLSAPALSTTTNHCAGRYYIKEWW